MGSLKRCSKCKETKPHTDFHKNRCTLDGLQDWCKTCFRKGQQTKKGRERQWRANHSEKGRATHERYLGSEKDKVVRRRYEASEKGRAARKRFNATKKGRAMYQRSCAKRRAVLEGSEATLTAEEWSEIRAEYKCCPYCGELFTGEPEMDHIVPISRGGTHTADNVVPACMSCNRSKSDKTVEEWQDGQEAL